MRRKLKTILGFYSPSFLRMHVGTTKSLINLNVLKDDLAESIYLHEYCHFIQDVTTTYGFTNICMTVDYMKFVNNHLIKLPPGSFSVPVLPIRNAADNVHSNTELSNIYLGSGDDDPATLTGCSIQSQNVTTNSGVLPVRYVEVEYMSFGKKLRFEFGALCILESMAYIIERACYPGCSISPDLPYASAEKVVELIFPEFGQNRLNVLALCDASLMTLHPGTFFYDTLLKIKTDKIHLSAPEEVYDICNLAAINFNGASNFRELFSIMSTEAITQMKGYFNDHRFDPLKDWIENMIIEAAKFRQNNQSFPLEIARGGKIGDNRCFASFLKNVGTPLVTNDAGETSLSNPKTQASLNYSTIWAIEQIHSVFWGHQKKCQLVNFCNAGGIVTDARCHTEPWERNLETSCAFGQMWRHWGLTGYVPI